MRVVLNVESEGRLRQTLWLRDNQCAEVGRIAWADLVVEDDPDLAEVHFALQCADAACRIRDLSGSGGTFVNGQQVVFSQLAHGDVVRAGRTTFCVQIDEDDTGQKSAANGQGGGPPRDAEQGCAQPAVLRASQEHERAESERCGRRRAAPSGERLPSDAEPLCVLLRLAGGFSAEYCVWLRDHQTLQVGRSWQADFPVASDASLEPFHFQLVTDRTNCYLHTLCPDLPVLVNQRPVATSFPLSDGDTIQAGQTQFAVTIRGGQRVEKAEPAGSAVAAEAAVRPVPPPLRYRQEVCRSELMCYASVDSQMSPLDIVGLLAANRRLFLVVNFPNARLPVPACLGVQCDLFAGHANSPRSLGRLMLISPDDPLDVSELWKQAIGSDAAIGVISERSTQEVLRMLQAASVTFSAPTILREQLANLPAGFVRPMLAGITAVVVESNSLGKWCVFADPAVIPTWSELGFPGPPETVPSPVSSR